MASTIEQTCYQSGNSSRWAKKLDLPPRLGRLAPQVQENYWLCRYCHQRRKQEACYEADSTTNAGRHLSGNKPGHSHGPNGPVPIASREGNIMGALAKSQVHIMRSKGIEVSQEVANEIAASFSTSRFQDALKDWVVADNQSLRVIETPQFRAMIAAVSPLAEALLWRSHQTLHDHIITEYNTYIPAVANYLREARSLIHVSFDNWTSTATRAHTGNNIAAAATTILRLFGVDNARVGYFVLDNASNNDTAVESLAEEFGFIASERRLRCCCHILNLSAQLVIWGKDRSAYENEAAHLEEEEKYMDEWRKYGPVGVLFDVIASICTPQTRQLLERLQCEEADYFNTFVRAAELHGPIDGYIECKLEEHSAATATSRRRKNREQLPAAQPRLYIREGGLNGKDWATITEYIRLLEPFAEATRLLEGRGRHGRHGAIWEVLVTFEWLLDQLEALKDRLKDVNYEDLDAPEDHLITNVNLAHCKLAEYYAKFDNAPVYYTATILHPHYKHHLSALWKVPDTHVTARDGVHYRDGWLDNNHRAFLRMWQGRKDSAATSAHTVTPPRKKPRLGISTSRSAFLQSSIEQSTRQLEASLAEDEYEIWKRQPAQLLGSSLLSKFAIDVLTIPAAAADCERTFSELGDMLGTRRLHMKPELISALQSLKSWKRLGIQPTTTSASGLARTLSEEEISKVQEHLSQFDSFTFTYREYKKDTEYIAGCLAWTARQCGYERPVAEPPKQKAPQGEGTGIEQKTQPTQDSSTDAQHPMNVSEFLGMAKSIASFEPKLDVPPALQRVFDRVVLARTRVAKVQNRFTGFTVEETVPLDELIVEVKDRQLPKVKLIPIEDDEDDLEDEFFFAVAAFLQDVHQIRSKRTCVNALEIATTSKRPRVAARHRGTASQPVLVDTQPFSPSPPPPPLSPRQALVAAPQAPNFEATLRESRAEETIIPPPKGSEHATVAASGAASEAVDKESLPKALQAAHITFEPSKLGIQPWLSHRLAQQRRKVTWICHYCYKHKFTTVGRGIHNVSQSPSAPARHLGEDKKVHGLKPPSKRTTVAPRKETLLERALQKGCS
ncbi:Dimer-Tnp-hAT domain containing protein [Pyrenophora tritici-repentis]|nr:Dimer-Tnp-hAT domain containing protein [Pyrenophora tritici-repentis]